MYLPQNVLTCMTALNRAGHRVYAVGGCVRDACLGLVPQDYDLCTDATPEQMHRIFADFRQCMYTDIHVNLLLTIFCLSCFNNLPDNIL